MKSIANAAWNKRPFCARWQRRREKPAFHASAQFEELMAARLETLAEAIEKERNQI
jgi:hypothetical protein